MKEFIPTLPPFVAVTLQDTDVWDDDKSDAAILKNGCPFALYILFYKEVERVPVFTEQEYVNPYMQSLPQLVALIFMVQGV